MHPCPRNTLGKGGLPNNTAPGSVYPYKRSQACFPRPISGLTSEVDKVLMAKIRLNLGREISEISIGEREDSWEPLTAVGEVRVQMVKPQAAS